MSKKHHAKVRELECIKAQILSESISYVKISDRVNHFANLPKKIVQRLKKMASYLKSCHRTSLKVVEDSIRKTQIEQSNLNDFDFGKEIEEGSIDMEKFVFVEYEDVAEPKTDPADQMHGNSEENDSTNSVSKMPTNSENQTEIVAKKDKKMRNRRYKAKRAAEKALAEAEAKKFMDKSAESLQNDNKTEENKKRADRVLATNPSCPLRIEATGEHHFQTLDWTNFTPTIWTCNHSDVFNGDVFGPVDVARISTESQSGQAMPIVGTPIVCGDLDVRDMRKMVADLVWEDEEEVLVNLGGDDFNQDNYEFYEEVSDESDANGETSKDEEVSEGSDGSFYVVKYPDTQVPKQACG